MSQMEQLPTILEPIEPGRLEEGLSQEAVRELKREIAAWLRYRPESLKDQEVLRYIYASVLDRHDLDCPHPFRTRVPGYALAFECRMCLSYVFPNKEKVE